MSKITNHKVSRRQALGGLAVSVAGSGLAASASAQTPLKPGEQAQGTCTLFPQATEGPYYFDPKLVRSDVSEGRPGLPLRLVLTVIESGPCTPIRNARVDIWHADAGGVYSGYAGQGDKGNVSTRSQTFLRGTQMTDDAGAATFRSVFPGWYPGRTPHIHVKVFLDTKTLVTGQVYFADDLSARIYREHAHYNKRPVADTTNKSDGLFRSGAREGGGIVLAATQEPDLLVASLLIAVDRSGAAGGRGRWRQSLGWLLGD